MRSEAENGISILKSFETSNGNVKLLKYEEESVYAVYMESASCNNYSQYAYKEAAMPTYNFYCYWLTNNAR